MSFPPHPPCVDASFCACVCACVLACEGGGARPSPKHAPVGPHIARRVGARGGLALALALSRATEREVRVKQAGAHVGKGTAARAAESGEGERMAESVFCLTPLTFFLSAFSRHKHAH